MNKMNIRGAEYPLKKIFSDDFAFTIPIYQRPYSWTTEEAEELFQDLIKALNGFEKPIDDLPPYFLGSIVLVKGEEPDAQVIDGQQRLTTITMLLSAIRSLSSPDYIEGLTAFLCEKGNIVTGTPTRYRLTLRKRDVDFFQKYIQDERGIEALKSLEDTDLSESQRNIRDNTLVFVRELQKLTQDQLTLFTQFLVNRCFLIVVSVSSPDLDSVYRIFSVLNSRGLALSYADILKTEIISDIPVNEQELYAKKWEDIETSLGSDLFEEVFINLRTISARARLRKGMIEEFHEYVYPRQIQPISPQDFIDKTLEQYARALNYIVKASYQGPMAKEINTVLKWLHWLDHSRWTPPALYYFIQHWRQPALVYQFLLSLERLVVSFMVCKVPPYKRIDRYCELLDAIYKGVDLLSPDSPLQLTPAESRGMLRVLDGDLYHLHYVCRYVLLRLDAFLSDGLVSHDPEKITIEHVLPRNLPPGSRWEQLFPTRDVHKKYVHRVGNLVLLSRSKNIAAENYDFDLKKQKYFFAGGTSTPFVLTNQLRDYSDWTPALIEQRQTQLIDRLKKLWKL